MIFFNGGKPMVFFDQWHLHWFSMETVFFDFFLRFALIFNGKFVFCFFLWKKTLVRETNANQKCFFNKQISSETQCKSKTFFVYEVSSIMWRNATASSKSVLDLHWVSELLFWTLSICILFEYSQILNIICIDFPN